MKMTSFESGKDADSISLWNLSPLRIIAYHNTVGTRCGSSSVRDSGRQTESEDRSKATAGSFKKLQEVELPIGKVGAEQPSTGA